MSVLITSTGATRVHTAVVGAGPTGLGAVWRLSHTLPSEDTSSFDLPFVLLDASSTPGGRAASHTTPEGFTFDHGGHVLFPHAEYAIFTELLDQLVPEWSSSVPIRGVWIADQFVPTPVQRNIHRLPLSAMIECLWGLWRRAVPTPHGSVEPNLREYLEVQFGAPLTRQVMGPLNQKMWAYPPEALGSDWSSHRSGSREKNIPDVNIRNVLCNYLMKRDEPSWSASSTVRYPLHGGMGSVWDRLYESIPARNLRLGKRIEAIHTRTKQLCLNDGSTVRYENLITSMPLNSLLRILQDRPDLQLRATEFSAASVQIFGFGLEGPIPAVLKGVHALSVPAPDIPFWRVNIPSNFSPATVPDQKNSWSLLCECSLPSNSTTVYAPSEIEGCLRQMKLLPQETKVVSIFQTSLAHGYPVPFFGRDKLLQEVQSALENLNIYSRGRFGGWRYEVSNQDHAFMQGVEVVDRLNSGVDEYTYRKTW